VLNHSGFHGFLSLGNPRTSYKRQNCGTWHPFRGNLQTGLTQGLKSYGFLLKEFPFQVSGSRGTSRNRQKLFPRFADVFKLFLVPGKREFFVFALSLA
jgi:hypothetical protein